MKKVTFEYGCKALGYTDGEFYVPDAMSDGEILREISDMAGFSFSFQTESGYEEQTEVVYRKVR